VTHFCEHCLETSGSIKGGKFYDFVDDCKLVLISFITIHIVVNFLKMFVVHFPSALRYLPTHTHTLYDGLLQSMHCCCTGNVSQSLA
jgi:hypothetical protein